MVEQRERSSRRSLGGRPWWLIVRGLTRWRTFYGLVAAPSVVREWVDFLRRYLLDRGEYPATFTVRTPLGHRRLRVFSHADVLTVMVCFVRRDYSLNRRRAHRVLDLGANIGVSAAYFLTRHQDNVVVCVEPVPRSCDRLRANLAGLEDRYRLLPVAVADYSGTASFGVDPTGVFAGIDTEWPDKIEVRCVDVNELIDEVSRDVGVIDVLKVDVEGFEERVAVALSPAHWSTIDLAFLEAEPTRTLVDPPLRQRQRDAICIIERRPASR